MNDRFDRRPSAKPAREEYRRRLPHLQATDKPLFVTFCTFQRWTLPESVRGLVLRHCLHDHRVKLFMFGAVVMPDHVHLVFQAMRDPSGNDFGLIEILQSIKSASAHSVNKALGRRGQVWQEESFDRVCRSDESVHDLVKYICRNPERKGLVREFGEYPYLWREWVEGQQ
ncbi:MAG TPA: transposase [Pirellulales bacterium]|nr:transposase [Pirellulales bacterium]